MCQTPANFSVTGLLAHPLPPPVSEILTPWSCCNLSLTKLNVNSFSPTRSHFLLLCLPVKKTLQSFLLRSFFGLFSFSCPANSGHSSSSSADARVTLSSAYPLPGFSPRLVLYHTGISAQFDFLDILMDICQILLLSLCFLFADTNSLISLPCSADLSPSMASPVPH